jgi:ribonuclease J
MIYVDKKETGLYRPGDYQKWEQDYLDLPNAVKADWIHDHQNEIVACFTFFDMNELIDVEPNPGSVCIHSASEPHNEEQVIDEQRFNCWLDHFGLQKHHFHASGHASGTDLKQVIEAINPKKLIPIHTEKPTIFTQLHPNVEMPKLEPY